MPIAFDWRVALTKEERHKLAQRGPIDCRPFDDGIEDVIPCHLCSCWLLPAFKHEYKEKVHKRRMDKLRSLCGDTVDGSPVYICATDDGRPSGVDGLLLALRKAHPERDPEKKDEDAA